MNKKKKKQKKKKKKKKKRRSLPRAELPTETKQGNRSSSSPPSPPLPFRRSCAEKEGLLSERRNGTAVTVIGKRLGRFMLSHAIHWARANTDRQVIVSHNIGS
jgi:hypothetical protein